MKKEALQVIQDTIEGIDSRREIYYNGPDGKRKLFNKKMLKPMRYIEQLILADIGEKT